MSSHPRNPAHWGTFGAAAAVLLAVVVLLLVQLRGADEPARPELTIGTAEQVGAHFHVPVTLRNDGARTAENVQVTSSLEVDGETVAEGDQTIDFLAGHEQAELVFVLPEDPDDGELTVEVSGFTVP